MTTASNITELKLSVTLQEQHLLTGNVTTALMTQTITTGYVASIAELRESVRPTDSTTTASYAQLIPSNSLHTISTAKPTAIESGILPAAPVFTTIMSTKTPKITSASITSTLPTRFTSTAIKIKIPISATPTALTTKEPSYKPTHEPSSTMIAAAATILTSTERSETAKAVVVALSTTTTTTTETARAEIAIEATSNAINHLAHCHSTKSIAMCTLHTSNDVVEFISYLLFSMLHENKIKLKTFMCNLFLSLFFITHIYYEINIQQKLFLHSTTQKSTNYMLYTNTHA